jgi:hypothetical protein
MGPRNAYKDMLDNVVSPITCVSMNHQNQLEQMANGYSTGLLPIFLVRFDSRFRSVLRLTLGFLWFFNKSGFAPVLHARGRFLASLSDSVNDRRRFLVEAVLALILGRDWANTTHPRCVWGGG